MVIVFLALISTFSLAETRNPSTYVFRISQGTTPAPGDFGHCTAVYVETTKEIYTAAHCYHFKPLNLRGTNGELLLDLSSASYNFLENEIGLLDILVISGFDEDALQRAKQDAKASPAKKGLSIVGFPAKYNTKNLSEFYCDKRSISPGYGPRAIEADLNTLHLNCETYTVGESEQKLNHLLHRDVAGLSGGAVFDDGKYIGVAYHYEVNDPIPPFYFKVQMFNDSAQTISVQRARRKYQLDTKLFEEAKLPKSVTSPLALLLMVDYGLPMKDINRLAHAYWQDAETLMLITQGGQELEVPRRKLSSSLLSYFEKLR